MITSLLKILQLVPIVSFISRICIVFCFYSFPVHYATHTEQLFDSAIVLYVFLSVLPELHVMFVGKLQIDTMGPRETSKPAEIGLS